MRKKILKYFQGDAVIWTVIVALSLISLLAVYSSTGTLAYKKMGGNTTYYLIKHGSILIFGIVMIFIVHHINYKYYMGLSILLIYLTIPLLLWTLIKGASLNEAARWVTLPGIGLTFQTSDFAKLVLIMFIARFLSKNQDNIKNFKSGFRSIIIWVILICGLIFPANFSTAAILFFTSLVLLFFGRVKITYILGVIGMGIVVMTLFILFLYAMPEDKRGRLGTWKHRVESFISGDDEENFQVEQAKIAIVTGGLIGKGPGNSVQRNFLPHPYSDFIYAIIIEEYGLIGGIFIILLYLILLYRAGVIVRKCNSQFAAFLTLGLTIMIVFQAFINMAVAVNLFPVTGQTLPFVSMGGTSIIFSSIAMGIVLNVSKTSKKIKSHEQDQKSDN
ncbi:MAG: FtsW/RodA/SpoVE family cell cycle protein [Marinilabiliales bacterium]